MKTQNKKILSFSYFDLKGSDLKRYLKPAVVLVTGDLTDAKSADYSGSEQYLHASLRCLALSYLIE